MSTIGTDYSHNVTAVCEGLTLMKKDRSDAQLQFLKKLRDTIKEEAHTNELRLTPICAVKRGEVIMSKKVEGLILKAGYSLEEAHQFFQASLDKHIEQLPKTVTQPENKVLLISLSTIELQAGQTIEDIPGSAYHQDGGGKVISTEITMIGDPDTWEGGSLDIVDPALRVDTVAQERFSEAKGRKPKELGKDGFMAQVRPGDGDTIIFDNKRLLHAVETPLKAVGGSTERTIYQLRLNDADMLPESVLHEYS